MGKLKAKKSKLKFLFLLAIVNILLLMILILRPSEIKKPSEADSFSELSYFSGNQTFDEIKDLLVTLARDKGAVYAFEVLKRANVGPGIDTHLMGHYIGDILYDQNGASGIEYCTHDFRNACSHTVVIGLFSEKGIGALDEIVEACKLAPGGKGAYNMCFHGLGHGVLAYFGYDLKKAVDTCSRIEKGRADGNEFPECVGGTIMEILSGGDHDRDLWSKKRKEFFEGRGPLYPCDDEMIPGPAKERCYSYLTPRLFELASGDINNPQEDDFAKAFGYCDVLSDNDPNKQTCYGDFGKEFVVLANDRDVRDVELMTEDQFSKVVRWCNEAEDNKAAEYCIESSIDSLFWGGENSSDVSLRFCGQISDTEQKNVCYSHLMELVGYYIDDKEYKDEFCRQLPGELISACKKQLRIN